MLRLRREAMVTNALTILAAIYVCYTMASLLEFWLR